MLENNQKEIILLEDLGMLYPKETSKQKYRYGLYKCYCGNQFKSMVQSVKSKHTQSCGCYHKKINIESSIKHGLTKHKIYVVWKSMMSRCNNIKNISYKHYGVRGITICKEWYDVKNFIEDMYPSYQDGLTLDRKENDKGYSKDNCRWANKSTQQRNKRKLQSNNTSGYRGVTFYKRDKKYKAQIQLKLKKISIGKFNTPLEAAKAYDQYVIDNNLEHTINGVL